MNDTMLARVVVCLIVVWTTIRMTIACSNDDVRLVGGSTMYDGRVELCVNEVWTRVCASSWRTGYEGSVVCRQLGCPSSNNAYMLGTGTQHGVYVVNCNTSPSSLILCSVTANYSCINEVGVTCNTRAVSVTVPPAQVRGVSISNIQTTSLTISYQAAQPSRTTCSTTTACGIAQCITGTVTYDVYCTNQGNNHRDWSSSTTSASIRATGLQSYTNYRCCVMARNNQGTATAACSITTRTLPRATGIQLYVDVGIQNRVMGNTAPSCPPLSLRSISPHTPTTMHLTWNPPQMSCRNGIIIRYTVRICRESTIPCRTVTSSSTSTTVGELQPYYYYEVSVAAYTVGEGPQSVRRLTTQQNIPNRAPQNLTNNTVSSTFVQLSWSPPPLEYQNGVIRRYNIIITNADTSQRVRETSTDQTSITVYSLHPHYNYTCSVAAYTVGVGPYTNHLVMMPEDVPSGSPSSFRLMTSDHNSRTLQLSWQPPQLDQQNGVIRRYEVKVCTSGECTNHRTTGLAMTVAGLHPHYWYDVSVAAFTVGRGTYRTESIQMPEDVPNGAPRDLTNNTVSSTTVQLSWSPPRLEYQNGVIRRYNIIITNADTSQRVREIFTDQTSITVYNLHPHYNYTCSVAAYTVGVGPYANHIVMMPEDAPSSPPQNLINQHLNSTSVKLSWDPPPPQDQNGVIRKYSVILRNTTMSQDYTTTETWLTLIQLTPNSTYHWTIAAHTVSIGPYSNDTSLYIPLPKKSKALEIGLYSTAGILFPVVVVIGVLAVWFIYRYGKIPSKIVQLKSSRNSRRRSRQQEKEQEDEGGDNVRGDKNQPTDDAAQNAYTYRLPWQRLNVKRNKKQSKKKAHTTSHQEESKNTESPHEVPVPTLPERRYLEDIDFVAGEFDMILNTRPDLPDRGYLEDIDFVVGEIFFPKKEGENTAPQNHEPALEMKDLSTNDREASSQSKVAKKTNVYQQPVGAKGRGETSHSMQANTSSDETTGESHYQPLIIQGTQRCSDYESVQIRSTSGISAHVTCSTDNNSSGHYQPLMLHKRQAGSEYAEVGAGLQLSVQKTNTAPQAKVGGKRDVKEMVILPKTITKKTVTFSGTSQK